MGNETKPGELFAMHRSSDPPIKVTREIPLWGILSVAAAICGQAAIVWFTQKEQGRLLNEAIGQIQQMRAEMSSLTLKNVEYRYEISDLQRRVSNLEKGKAP